MGRYYFNVSNFVAIVFHSQSVIFLVYFIILFNILLLFYILYAFFKWNKYNEFISWEICVKEVNIDSL